MPRRPDHVPKYRKHKRSRKAIVTFPNGFGQRRDYQLGDFGSKESKAEYRRLLAEWLAGNRQQHPDRDRPHVGPDLTMNEFLDRYWSFAEEYYRLADGSQTLDLKDIKMSLRPLRFLTQGTGPPRPRLSGMPLEQRACEEADQGPWKGDYDY